MNKMQTIAKIALISLGIFIVIEILKTVLPSLILIFFSKQSDQSMTINLLTLGLILLLTIAIIFFLIVRSTNVAGKITANYQPSPTETSSDWLPTAYKIIFVIMGILFIYMTLPNFVVFLLGLASAIKNGKSIGIGLIAIRLGSDLVKLFIAVYLFIGAPHIVKWQVGKSKPSQPLSESNN